MDALWGFDSFQKSKQQISWLHSFQLVLCHMTLFHMCLSWRHLQCLVPWICIWIWYSMCNVTSHPHWPQFQLPLNHLRIPPSEPSHLQPESISFPIFFAKLLALQFKETQISSLLFDFLLSWFTFTHHNQCYRVECYKPSISTIMLSASHQCIAESEWTRVWLKQWKLCCQHTWHICL